MGEPAIRYTTTADEVRVAYCDSGTGFPLVLMPTPVQHLSLMWRSKYVGRFYEGLQKRFRLIQYDGRGLGLSDRGLPAGHTSTDCDFDLEAVLRELGQEQFLLLGPHGSSHVAVRYAAAHPERVRGLILWQAIANYEGTEAGFMAGVAEQNWERAMVMLAQIFLPGEDLGGALHVVRASCTREDFIKQARAGDGTDVAGLLPHLQVPVLLLYKSVAFRETAVLARTMATGIAGSRLVFLEDDGDLYGYPRDSSRLIAHIEAFVNSLGIETEAARSPETAAARSELSAELNALTPREGEVLRMIAHGHTNKEIARELLVSDRTVARHVTNLYAKIDARSKADATAFAIRNGLT
jgi:DNA-binding CsgD family transcriptional regulator/pimeloyl-ACP methyl ester carboxylesterase